jgi:hypothetical protein
MVFNIFVLKVLICIHIFYFSLVQFRSQGSRAFAERERETGGWAQFDWMLDGGSFKAWPIEFRLFCFHKKLLLLFKLFIADFKDYVTLHTVHYGTLQYFKLDSIKSVRIVTEGGRVQ